MPIVTTSYDRARSHPKILPCNGGGVDLNKPILDIQAAMDSTGKNNEKNIDNW